MPTTFGTAHFVSKQAAFRYYARQETDKRAVDQKIEEGDIAIGPPPVPYGYGLVVDREEGRYKLVDVLPGQNRSLYDQMIQKGCRWKSGPRYQHFVDAEGDYAEYPVGYITGPCRAEENGSGTPYYISVNGADGWRQRSGSLADIPGLKQWALDTQNEILSQEHSSEGK
jgi:hypothetical protein